VAKVPSVTQSPSSGFDLYDVAWLAGGRRRVVHTAVAVLVENARLHVEDPTGELKVLVRQAEHPVELAVLDAIGTRSHRGLETIEVLVRSDPRLTAVGDRLHEAGLIRVGEPRARLIGRSRAVRLTRAGRRALDDVRRSTSGGRAAVQVALEGLEKVPAGLPAALAVRAPVRWSWTRVEPAEAREAAIYPGNIGSMGGAGGSL
jgi:hypothetical protein